MRRTHLMAVLTVAGTMAAAAAATPAMAAGSTCRASALRVQLLTLVQEPVVANPAGSACFTAVTPAATIRADTAYSTDGYYTNAQAHANYSGAVAALPNVLELAAATSAESYVNAGCFGGATTVSGWGQVHNVTVQPSVLAPPIIINGDQPQVIPISGVGTLYVNREIRTATSIIRQALFLDTPSVDTVVAEAKAGLTC